MNPVNSSARYDSPVDTTNSTYDALYFTANCHIVDVALLIGRVSATNNRPVSRVSNSRPPQPVWSHTIRTVISISHHHMVTDNAYLPCSWGSR